MKSNYEQYKRYLSKEEEIDLYHKMKAGDDDARDELILAHSYLVIGFAYEYSRYAAREDLEQEGFLALTKAVDKYNIEKGSLRIYSSRAIRTHMLRFLDKNRHVIKMPTPQVHELLTLMNIKNELTIELKREPTYGELMEDPRVIEAYTVYSSKPVSTQFSLEEYVKLVEFGSPVSSLNEPVSDDSSYTLEDTIEDPYQQSQYNRIETEDVGNALMSILDDREKFILKSFSCGLTGKEIGDKLGISAQAVFENQKKAIRKVKYYTKNNPELKEIIEQLGFEC